jgi:hypothetical protein
MKEHLSDSSTKYEDPGKYESFLDNNLYFPLSDLLVTPLRTIGLTPNNVTILSSLFTLSTIYLLHIEKIEYACLSYFMGYLLDCVDGNMARKYNMGSKYGMALDLVSDQVTHYILLGYIIYSKGYNNWYLLSLLILGYLCCISVGITEAKDSVKKTNSDNFYKIKEEEVKDEKAFIFKFYLSIYKGIYNNYKFLFSEYNENKVSKYLLLLKEFGPGNMNILAIILLYNLYTNNNIPKIFD